MTQIEQFIYANVISYGYWKCGKFIYHRDDGPAINDNNNLFGNKVLYRNHERLVK
jgi:hypothetical protein